MKGNRKNMDENYNKMAYHPPLRKFAFIGTRVQFLKKLRHLANMAEPESWYYDNPGYETEEEKEFAVLYSYIFNTFSKAQDDDKIFSTNSHSIFNTGLLNKFGEEIFMLFEKNERYDGSNEDIPHWCFKLFVITSSHEIPKDMRANLPTHVDYFENCPSELYFDTKKPVSSNLAHVILENRDRLPDSAQSFPDELLIQIIGSAEQQMKKRILRNNRLVVPQYYNKKIMYLAPMLIGKDVVPVAIESHDETYRINTILTPGMAYCNARLIMKPESNWLKNK